MTVFASGIGKRISERHLLRRRMSTAGCSGPPLSNAAGSDGHVTAHEHRGHLPLPFAAPAALLAGLFRHRALRS